MKIIDYKFGTAILFSSGIIITKSTNDFYQFYITKFTNFELTKSAIKTLKKNQYPKVDNVTFADVINYGLEYVKGVYQVKCFNLSKDQEAIFELVKKYALPESKLDIQVNNPLEVLENLNIESAKNGTPF